MRIFDFNVYLISSPYRPAIDQLIAKGWKSIEIMGEGKNHGRLLFEMDTAQVTEISKIAKDNGVSFGLHLPIVGFNPACVDDETEDIWKQCVPIIESLDVKYVLLHPGENSSVEAGIESTARFVKKMLQELPPKTDLVVENIPAMNNGIGVSIDQLISILHKVNDNRARMMLDTGHCYMNENVQFLTNVKKPFLIYTAYILMTITVKVMNICKLGKERFRLNNLLRQLKGKDVEFVLETNTVARAEYSKRDIMRFIQD